jgi:hypothetical protein
MPFYNIKEDTVGDEQGDRRYIEVAQKTMFIIFRISGIKQV